MAGGSACQCCYSHADSNSQLFAMEASTAFNLLCIAAVALVAQSVCGIKVQQKADLPDVADRAHHHSTGKATRARVAMSPGIVSAVLKVKLTSPADAKPAACSKTGGSCAKHEEWRSQDSDEDSEEDDTSEDVARDKAEQDQDAKTVKVVSGLDDTVEEDDYEGSKSNEQNEIPDIPVYIGNYVGVNTREEYEDLGLKEWNPRERLAGGYRNPENSPPHKYGETFQLEYPLAQIPRHYNIHGSIFEIPTGFRQGLHPSAPVARTPRPYHNLLAEYRQSIGYPLQAPPTPHHQPTFSVQQRTRHALLVDDKIDLPKEKENLEDGKTTSTSTEITIIGKMYDI